MNGKYLSLEAISDRARCLDCAIVVFPLEQDQEGEQRQGGGLMRRYGPLLTDGQRMEDRPAESR